MGLLRRTAGGRVLNTVDAFVISARPFADKRAPVAMLGDQVGGNLAELCGIVGVEEENVHESAGFTSWMIRSLNCSRLELFTT